MLPGADDPWHHLSDHLCAITEKAALYSRLCHTSLKGEFHRNPHLSVGVKVQEQWNMRLASRAVLRFANPASRSRQAANSNPTCSEALDTGKEIVPFCSVVLFVLGGEIVYLEFDRVAHPVGNCSVKPHS
jgi:hypothetical protein